MKKFKNKYRIPSNRKPNWNYDAEGLYFITIVTQHRICNLGIIKNKKMELSSFGKIIDSEFLKSFDIRKELYLDEYQIMPNHIHALIGIISPIAATPAADNLQMHGRASILLPATPIPPPNANSTDNVQMHGRASLLPAIQIPPIADSIPPTADSIPPPADLIPPPTDSIPPPNTNSPDNVQMHGRASLQPPATPISPPPAAPIPPPPATPNPHPSPHISSIKRNPPIRLPKSISSFIGGFKSAVNTKIDDYIDEHQLKIAKYNKQNHFFQPNYHDHIVRNEDEYYRIKNYIINNPKKWTDDVFHKYLKIE
jgi:putative transposase